MKLRSTAAPADALATLDARAARYAAPREAASDEERVWVAELSLGPDRLAFALARIAAVVPLRTVTPVPRSPPHVIGVMRHRGELVVVWSLASLLGGRAMGRDPSVLLIVERGGRLAALDAEHVPIVLQVTHEAWARSLEQPGAVTPLPGPDGRLLQRVDLDTLWEAR